jgi:ribonuclease HI
MANEKYYVIWVGAAPGVYDSWDEARIQVEGYPGASYRGYKSKEEAVQAFRDGYDKDGLLAEVARQVKKMNREGRTIEWNPSMENNAPASATSAPTPASAFTEASAFAEASTQAPQRVSAPTPPQRPTPYILDSIAVDAACSGNPGPMEYRGVHVRSGKELFHFGPVEGTNNIGEFLAIVHCLAMQEKQGTRLPIYSDSVNAQKWVKAGLCRTKLECNERNRALFDLIRRAESWLRQHRIFVPIYKWETKQWGEIPADFGRK